MNHYEYGLESMLARWIVKISPGPDSLSPTETVTLLLVAMGSSNSETASTLGVSRRTTESHLRTIYQKLGVKSDRQALAKILEFAAREALED